MEKLKVGLSGAPRGSSFVGALRSIPHTEVTCICDPDTDRLSEIADRHRIPERYADYGEMLDKGGPDVVVVASPMQFHVPQAVSALERGIHVLSEVTAAVSLRQCEELVRAARDSDAKYMMAENYCYRRPNILVGSMVRQGLFGEVYFGEGEYVHDVKHMHRDARGRPTWRTIWQVGKRGCTYGTHSLGPVLEWFDQRVEWVTCLGSGVHTNPEHVMDDSVIMLCKTSSDALIKIRLDMLSNRPHNMVYYAIQGTRGCYEAPRGFGDEHKIWLRDRSEGKVEWRSLWDFEEEFMPEIWRKPPEEARSAGHGGGDYFVVSDFVSSILESTKPRIDVYKAMDFTVPGLVSERSILNHGQAFTVPDFRDWDGEESIGAKVEPLN
jgi:predicted dehydrogenase